MTIIVGLGNPGSQYVRTRHNVGFTAVEYLKNVHRFPEFTLQAKFKAEVSKKGDILLVKPQTYMNQSGEAVSTLMRMYKNSVANLYVVHDDLDLELGNWKIQLATGPKVHNGLLSLYQQLGTKEFWHVRVGVDGRQGDRSIPPDRYVLMPFASEEEVVLQQAIKAVVAEMGTRAIKSKN